MAYATTAQLSEGMGKPVDETRASALLDRAGRLIDAECAAAHVDVTAIDAGLLSDVSCQMVARVIGAGIGPVGATQGSMTVGPFSGSATWASPMGDLYLSKTERRVLGISDQRVGFARAMSAMDGEVG